MVIVKEFRICMPLTVEEYQIGQLYMIARHSLEQSGDGEGVEVVVNEECSDPEHGTGQYTVKRIHLSHRLPFWLKAICPRIIYITETSWNYYPYTRTEYTCSFIPKLQVTIRTKYEDNNGSSENCHGLSEDELKCRLVDDIDIAFDDLNSPKHYKREEDPKFFKSIKTNRGPLIEGWRETDTPIMCSYKLVNVNFDMWGLQTKVEEFAIRSIRDVLLLGHRQAFTWIDEWYGMTMDDVREYEKRRQSETNRILVAQGLIPNTVQTPSPITDSAAVVNGTAKVEDESTIVHDSPEVNNEEPLESVEKEEIDKVDDEVNGKDE